MISLIILISILAVIALYGAVSLLVQTWRMFSLNNSEANNGSEELKLAAAKLRCLTVIWVGGLGCFCILVMILGMGLGGPLEPPGGVTVEEHIQRVENGYYNRQTLGLIGSMAAYLVVVFLSHPWIIQSNIRYRVVTALLLLPVLLLVPNVVRAIASIYRYGISLADFIMLLLVAGFKLSFYGLPILSLYFSWKTRTAASEPAAAPEVS